MNKVIRTILILLCTAVMVYSAWQIWGILRTYREGQDNYTALEQYISIPGPESTPTQAATEAPLDITATEPTVPEMPDLSGWPQVDFPGLQQINPDTVGWIIIQGTNISYPIVQSDDNDYYLDHLFDGTANRAGCIFLDHRCAGDFSDLQSIIYGHHLRDKTMFTALMQYKKQAFYDTHSTALLLTPTAYYTVRFFSGYVSDNRSTAWALDLTGEAYAAWLEELREKSCFDSDYIPTVQDRVVTLSTCTYEFDSAKFVLHGYIEEAVEIPAIP